MFQGYVRLWGCSSLVLRNLHKNGTIKSLQVFCLVMFNKVDMKWTMNHPRWDSEFFAVFCWGKFAVHVCKCFFLNFQPAVLDYWMNILLSIFSKWHGFRSVDVSETHGFTLVDHYGFPLRNDQMKQAAEHGHGASALPHRSWMTTGSTSNVSHLCTSKI